MYPIRKDLSVFLVHIRDPEDVGGPKRLFVNSGDFGINIAETMGLGAEVELQFNVG